MSKLKTISAVSELYEKIERKGSVVCKAPKMSGNTQIIVNLLDNLNAHQERVRGGVQRSIRLLESQDGYWKIDFEDYNAPNDQNKREQPHLWRPIGENL